MEKIEDITRRVRASTSFIPEQRKVSIKGIARITRTWGPRFWALCRAGIACMIMAVFVAGSIGYVNAPMQFGTAVLFADTLQDRAALESQLQQVETQIDSYQQNIAGIQGQKKTLANEIKLLDAQTARINLQIKALDLQIQRLNTQINDVGIGIQDSETKIQGSRAILAQSLNSLYRMNQASLLEILLSQDTMSGFFDEVNAQTSIEDQARQGLDTIKVMKTNLQNQETDLIASREDQQALRAVQQEQRQELAQKRSQKNVLLAETKGKESSYQKLLQQSKQTAAQIRSQLYQLLGGGEIKFQDALQFANFASQNSGVRAALILAVLDKESALGKNVGKCSWKTAMSPTRDQPIFVQITSQLGLNPDSMPVSCPILSDGSYGGAMGIAQFIPSTWVQYVPQIQRITGSYPSPWNPRDAFLATALYLAQAGATNQSFSAERVAAAKYYAGSRWRYYIYSYGSNVMDRASYYSDQIATLQKATS